MALGGNDSRGRIIYPEVEHGGSYQQAWKIITEGVPINYIQRTLTGCALGSLRIDRRTPGTFLGLFRGFRIFRGLSEVPGRSSQQYGC